MSRIFPTFLVLTLMTLPFSACSTPATKFKKADTVSHLETLAQLMIRSFEIEDNTASPGLTDRRVEIRSPHLTGVWFYSQLDKGIPRTLYRQRVNNLKPIENTDKFILVTYRINSPENYVDAWNDPESLNTLAPSNLEEYFDNGCDQIWKKRSDGVWTGYVDPAKCQLFSQRRQMDIRIESESRLTADTLQTSERGFDSLGTYLWGSKIGELLTLNVTDTPK